MRFCGIGFVEYKSDFHSIPHSSLFILHHFIPSPYLLPINSWVPAWWYLPHWGRGIIGSLWPAKRCEDVLPPFPVSMVQHDDSICCIASHITCSLMSGAFCRNLKSKKRMYLKNGINFSLKKLYSIWFRFICVYWECEQDSEDGRSFLTLWNCFSFCARQHICYSCLLYTSPSPRD